MGRTQTVYGPPLEPSGSLDRFANQLVFEKGKVFGDQCINPAGTCGVLPAFAIAPRSDGEKNVDATDEDIMLCELWYRLPRDEQVRFGGCFSRMILKILNRYDDCNGEGAA